MMSSIFYTSREDLSALGLSTDHYQAFIDQRSKKAALGKDALSSENSGLRPESIDILNRFLAEQGNRPDTSRPPSLRLHVRPTPPRFTDKRYFLVVQYNRVTDDVEYVDQRTFLIRGPSNHEFYDLSFEHIIDLRLKDKDALSIFRRTLLPPSQHEAEDTDISDVVFPLICNSGWTIEPPLRSDKRWGEYGPELFATLLLDTLRPVEVLPFISVVSNHIERSGQYQVVGNPTFRFDGLPVCRHGVQAIIGVDHRDHGTGRRESFLGRADTSNTAVVRMLKRLSISSAELDFEGNFRFDKVVD